MALTPAPVAQPPITEEAFLADRQHFWSSWCGFVLTCVIAIVAILVLMAIFLL